MNKDTWIGIAAIVIILGGIVAYAQFAPRHTETPSLTGTSTDAVINDNQPYYVIQAHAPTKTPLAVSAGANADAAAVALMQQQVSSAVTAFKVENNVASITPADAATMGLSDTRKYSLDIEYLATTTPSTVSYVYSVYYDTLGAHPNGTYITDTFDAKSGAKLAITDLFQPGQDVYNELSRIAQQHLPAIIANYTGSDTSQVDTDYIKSGTGPEAQNFQWFYVANGNLMLVFPPYQVGPYALGTVILPIPLSSLPNVKPAYK